MSIFRNTGVIRRKRKENTWGPLRYALYTVLTLGLLAYLFVPIFTKKNGLLERRSALEEQIKQVRQANVRMDDEVNNLETDNYVIEKIAREELGLTKPGEIVYKVVSH